MHFLFVQWTDNVETFLRHVLTTWLWVCHFDKAPTTTRTHNFWNWHCLHYNAWWQRTVLCWQQSRRNQKQMASWTNVRFIHVKDSKMCKILDDVLGAYIHYGQRFVLKNYKYSEAKKCSCTDNGKVMFIALELFQ